MNHTCSYPRILYADWRISFTVQRGRHYLVHYFVHHLFHLFRVQKHWAFISFWGSRWDLLKVGFAKLPVFMFCFLLLLLDHLLYMLNLFWKVSMLQTTCLLVHHTVSDTLYRCTFTVLELGVSWQSNAVNQNNCEIGAWGPAVVLSNNVY